MPIAAIGLFAGALALLVIVGVATLVGSTGPVKERRIRHGARREVDRIMADYHRGAFSGAQAAYRLREIEVPLDVIQRKLTEGVPAFASAIK